MKKILSLIVMIYITLTISAFADSIHKISLGEEDESVIFYNNTELYFMLPYKQKMIKLDRSLLAYDSDGFLKFTYNGRQVLIIEGPAMRQMFGDFRRDGINNYDYFTDTEEYGYGAGPFRSYNVKSISSSSYLKENQYGHDLAYTPINLFRAFEEGCRCHPYWWNKAHIPWVEGVAGNGVNETISIEFNNPVYSFSILNGYADVQNMKLFKENGRVKKLKVEDLTNSRVYIMDFEDKVYFNYVELLKPSKSVKLTILEVYEGSKYSDTCISAIIDSTYAPSHRDWERESFEEYKNRCSYTDDTSLFEKYFESVSQPVGNYSIYEETESVAGMKNLLHIDSYYINNIHLDVREDDISGRPVITYSLGSERYESQYSSMYIDEYGYKHFKLFDKEKNLTHHFTVIDTHFVPLIDINTSWTMEPSGWRYSFFEHTTEFLKDDSVAVSKYFVPSLNSFFNGNNIKNLKASSYLTEGGTSYIQDNTAHIYDLTNNLIGSWSDHILPWAEGKQGNGIGETLEFDLPDQTGRFKLNWDIRILNGYVNPLKPHLFKENNRIKKALLETDTGLRKEVEFNDEVEFTQIVLPSEVKHVKLTILEVYKGTKYSDTCITAVEVANVASGK